MKLYVIRHGQTNWNVERRIQGNSDIALNETGKKQAIAASKLMKGIDAKVIISSPLIRAVETAKAIQAVMDIPLILDKRAIERNFGEFEGMRIDEMDFEDSFDYQKNLMYDRCENIRSFFERVYAFLDDLKTQYANETIVLVTHGAVSVAIYYYLNNKQYDNEPLSHMIPNASPICFEIEETIDMNS